MADEEKIDKTDAQIDEKPVLNVEKDIIKDAKDPEAKPTPAELKPSFDVAAWMPKTELGKRVKSGQVTSILEALDSNERILEPEIVDLLMPGLETDILWIGQARGKFGGGQRRLFKQTQKKTPEGNKPSFSTLAVVGNNDGLVGIGYGKSRDTLPAREKAIRNAKLNIIKIRRGSGSWESNTREPHSIPYAVEGKSGSVKIKLMPAPKGKGIVCEPNCARVLELAGIKDCWSKASGQTRKTRNLIMALFGAMEKLTEHKITPKAAEAVGMIEGPIVKSEVGQ